MKKKLFENPIDYFVEISTQTRMGKSRISIQQNAQIEQ